MADNDGLARVPFLKLASKVNVGHKFSIPMATVAIVIADEVKGEQHIIDYVCTCNGLSKGQVHLEVQYMKTL